MKKDFEVEDDGSRFVKVKGLVKCVALECSRPLVTIIDDLDGVERQMYLPLKDEEVSYYASLFEGRRVSFVDRIRFIDTGGTSISSESSYRVRVLDGPLMGEEYNFDGTTIM